MTEVKTDSDNQVILEVSEEDQIHMDLFDIGKACKSLKKPMNDRGLRYKIEAIENLVRDIIRRIDANV